MKSYRILRHSIRQVTGNLPAALILSLPVVIASIASEMIMPMGFEEPEAAMMTPARGWGFIVGLLVLFYASLLMAVNWHRHVLLEEPATLRPRSGRMGIYALRVLQISVLAIVATMMVTLAVIVVGMLFEISTTPLEGGAAPSPWVLLIAVVGLTLGIGISFWMYAFMMRLSVMLPAAAVGKGIGLRQALTCTRGTTGMMVMLALLMGVLMIVLAIPMIVMQVAEWFVFAAVLGVVLNWFLTLLGVSVITTLYGHYVEGRALN